MDAVGGNLAIGCVESSGEFGREEDVREFRVAVCVESGVSIGAPDPVQIQRDPLVSVGGSRDDPGALAEVIEQVGRQQDGDR